MNSLGSSFHLLTQARMSASKAWTDWWLPLRMSSSVMKPNQRSTWLVQLELVGDEMHVEVWLFDQPSVDRRRLVSAVVVTDQVHFQVVGDFVVNLGQELLKLNHSMPPVDRGDDGPVGDVERGEQAGHAAAQIVVDAPLGHHRQHGAGTSQRLDLKLRAPRGAALPNGGGRTPSLGRRSGLVKLRAA